MSILTVMHLKPFKSRFPTFFFVSREIKVVNEFFIFTQKKISGNGRGKVRQYRIFIIQVLCIVNILD